MKKARDSKPIHTIPAGVYESGIISHELKKDRKKPDDITTDEQGNGYPSHNKRKD